MALRSVRFASPAALAAIACALALGACASTVSVAGFKGEEHEVAQVVANLQADTSSQNQARVCGNDLAHALVQRLNQAQEGCQHAIKEQMTQIDPGLEMRVESVHLAGTAAARTATASVKSTFEGKSRISTLLLVKEGSTWKISGLQ
jgi:hypothetical protein